MLRLIRAYYRREYRNVPLQNLVMIVGSHNLDPESI